MVLAPHISALGDEHVALHRFRLMFERSPMAQGLITPGSERRVIGNEAMAALFGMSVAEFSCVQPMSLVHPDDQDSIAEQLLRLGTGEIARVSTCARMVRANGDVFAGELVATALHDNDDEFESLLLTLADVTERKRLEAELERRALHDDLTGLANRAALAQHLEIASKRRHHAPLAALFIDLDNFKAVNDGSGHAAGDEVLRRVADALRRNTRGSDIAARVGGDEFVVICELEEPEHLAVIAERIRGAIANCLRDTPGSQAVTASIGATLAYDDEEPAALLRRADTAAYIAKHAGKDRCEVLGTRA